MAMKAVGFARSAASHVFRSGSSGALLPRFMSAKTSQDTADSVHAQENKKTMVILSTSSGVSELSSFTSFDTFLVQHDPRMLELFAKEIKARGGYEVASVNDIVLSNLSPQQVARYWETYEKNVKELSAKMAKQKEVTESIGVRMKQIEEDTGMDYIELFVIKMGKQFLGEKGFTHVRDGYTLLPYAAWITLWALVIDTLFASDIPPTEWPSLLNRYRLLQVHNAIDFYQKDTKELGEVDGLLIALKSTDISAEDYKSVVSDVKMYAVDKIAKYYVEKATKPLPNPPAAVPLPRILLPDCAPVQLPTWPCKPMAAKPYLSPPLGRQPVPKLPKD